ncbi:hypothetical protein R1flu_010265 [Riccia fluitans]|uniref:Uncharacterized protein n=1 Tax=Riccia fluitans TaxID=41844 RepID=A0ABD1Z5E3_9MARC
MAYVRSTCRVDTAQAVDRADVVYRVYLFSGVWVERAVTLFLAVLKGVEYMAFAWRGSCPYGCAYGADPILQTCRFYPGF